MLFLDCLEKTETIKKRKQIIKTRRNNNNNNKIDKNAS